MPMKLLTADDFRSAAKAGEAAPEGTVFRFSTTEPDVKDEETRTVGFVFSDSTIDHSGDSIDPKGWDLGIFKRNPVALFSHMSWDPPIGRASGVKVQNDKLVGDIEFAAADVYEFADTIYRLVKGKFLNAVSVGFMPKEWAWSSDKDRPYGIDFKKQTLLEISVCPVPCNPNALGEARSIGVDTRPLVEWAERVLDSGETAFLPRKELEGLRTQAKGAEPKRFYVQADQVLTIEAANRIRETVKIWQADPADVLVLPKGLTLHAIGGDSPELVLPGKSVVAEMDEALEAAKQAALAETAPLGAAALEQMAETLAKAGRRISAANKAKLQAALDMSSAHHQSISDCIKDVMGSEDPAEVEPDADFDDEPPGPTEQPPGSVVQESVDDDLSPEERRLKEARAIKASLEVAD